jgi:hypothetical protein
MKKRPILLIAIALNVVVLVALAFAYPHLMVSPGPLVKGHEEITQNCFACHSVWRGATSERCIACHAVADIGVRTTVGTPIANATIKGSFHQNLVEQNCLACHSDHQGPRLTKRSRKPFSHELLKVSMRDTCSTCHSAPKDTVHREIKTECGTCHQSTRWKPAHFDHALLAPAVLNKCESCHSAPTDPMHRQIKGRCMSCHKDDAWKPATFDHNKYFVLDRDHQTTCETCHKSNDYSRYTCYGCHEHSLAKIRRKHEKEGIPNFERCVDCHRDPRVEPEKRGEGERRDRQRD